MRALRDVERQSSGGTQDRLATMGYRLVWSAERHPLLFTASVALTARLTVAAGIRLLYGGFLFGDDVYFARLATDVVRGDTDGWIPHDHGVYGRMRAFLVPLVMLYRVFGDHSFAGQLLVVLFGTLAALLTTRLAMEWLPKPWAVGAGLIVALLPSQVLFSSLTLRDAQSWMLLVGVGVLVAIANRTHGVELGLVLAATTGALGLLGFLRLHTFVVGAWSAAVAACFGRWTGRLPRIAGFLLIALVLPVLFHLGPGGATFLRNMGSLEDRRAAGAIGANTAVVSPSPAFTSVEAREELANGTVRVYFPDARVRDLLPDGSVWEYTPDWTVREIRPDGVVRRLPDAPTPSPPPEIARFLEDLRNREGSATSERQGLAYLPAGLVVYLIEPLPWRSGSLEVTLAKIEMLFWYPLLLLGVMGVGVIATRLHRSAAYPMLAAGGLTLGYALAQGNFGTAFRHRGEIVWAVALAATTGLHWLYQAWQSKR